MGSLRMFSISVLFVVLCVFNTDALQHTKEKLVAQNAPFVIDEVDINQLTKEELNGFLYAEDEKLWAEIDLWVGKQTLAERTKHRVKRAWPIIGRLAWTAGRALFRSLSRKTPQLSRSAGKLTKQYQKNGNFGTTLRDFRSFKPNNVKTFRGPKGLKGAQGTFGRNGKWTVKARSRSSNGSPTLEVYRTNKGARSVLRKLRYNKSNRKLP